MVITAYTCLNSTFNNHILSHLVVNMATERSRTRKMVDKFKENAVDVSVLAVDTTKVWKLHRPTSRELKVDFIIRLSPTQWPQLQFLA